MKKLILFSLCLLLCSCGSTPKSIVTQPVFVKQTEQAKDDLNNGSLFNSQSVMLFEDKKNYQLGDVLTVDINEILNAKITGKNYNEKSSSMKAGGNISLPLMGKGMTDKFNSLSLESNSGFKNDGKGEINSSNSFIASISVQVMDIQGNNLLVAGEKQVAVNGENSIVRISGVVNKKDIVFGSRIKSEKMANLRVEQVNGGALGDIDTPWFQRIMMKLSPF